jgi:nucleotide-binding universal stress UspA family protein
MQVEHILVPIDGSELSLKAADHAAALATHLDATITLFTAVDPPEADATYVSPDALGAVRQGVWRAAEVMQEQAAARIRARNARVETRIVWGAPASAIVTEADLRHQLVVMGSRGLGLLPADRQLLGSVTERVLRRTRRPVLVVPAEAAA